MTHPSATADRCGPGAPPRNPKARPAPVRRIGGFAGFISENEWRQVPVRLDAERWASRPGCRKVLAVVHTVTVRSATPQRGAAAQRRLRVQVMFTMAPDVFSNGVQEFLASLRGVVLPWHQAVETRFASPAAGHEGAIS